MSVSTTAHLDFRGNTREALTFYRSVFGANGGGPAAGSPWRPILPVAGD